MHAEWGAMLPHMMLPRGCFGQTLFASLPPWRGVHRGLTVSGAHLRLPATSTGDCALCCEANPARPRAAPSSYAVRCRCAPLCAGDHHPGGA